MTHEHATQKARWYSDEAKYNELRNILQLPVLQEALQLTADAGAPKMVGSELSPTERINALAVEHARVAGWREALNHLYRLTTPPVINTPHERKSWSHKAKQAPNNP